MRLPFRPKVGMVAVFHRFPPGRTAARMVNAATGVNRSFTM